MTDPLRRRTIVAAVAAVVAAGPATAADEVARGRAIAATRCGACHATGATDASPHPAAPPFRLLRARYPVAHLAEALAEGIVTGHPAMPAAVFTPDEIAAFLAYLEAMGRDEK